MDVAQVLGYKDSPNFLLADKNFPHAQELGYVLRKARAECGLQGVYILRPENDKALPIPVLYFCQANTEAQAQQIHKTSLESRHCAFRPRSDSSGTFGSIPVFATDDTLFRYRNQLYPSSMPLLFMQCLIS